MEREEREKRKRNIIKRMSEKEEIIEGVRRIGKEIRVEMDNKKVRKIRTRREEKGEMVIV